MEDVTWGEQRQEKKEAAVFVASCEGKGGVRARVRVRVRGGSICKSHVV